MDDHQATMLLAIGYTFIGVLIFTAVVTCLSLIGIVKFINPGQQQRVFQLLIVELVAIGIGAFAGFLRFDPKAVAYDIRVEDRADFAKVEAQSEAHQDCVPTPLRMFNAVSERNLQQVKSFLELGASVEMVIDPDLNHPLHLAAERCYKDERCDTSLIKFLLQKGADRTVPNRYGDTPVVIARARCTKCPDAIRLLEDQTR